MDIRETLGQMVRGSSITMNGLHVRFNNICVFSVWRCPGGNIPLIETKSLKEVSEYVSDTNIPAVAAALKYSFEDEPEDLAEITIPEAVTDENPWSERIPGPFSEVMAAPYVDEVAKAQDGMVPPTQLYGRVKRDVKLVDSVDIPNVGTLLEPLTPYGYVNTDGLKNLCQDIHRYNVDAGWWTDINTGERLNRNVPEMLMLIVSEVSEAMEGYRKDKMDDKLPHRKMIEVELADALIRICDTAEGLGLDLAGAVQEKVLFNTSRSDHKIENRLKADGKKF